MNKIMILMAGAAITIGATTAKAQISFAPEIGINLANMHGKDTAFTGKVEKDENKLKLGVKVGVNANIAFGSRLMLQPGLFYSIKGFKSDDTYSETQLGVTTTVSRKNNVTLHYFEVPVNLQYMFNDPGEGRFFVGVGGYIGVAFSGKNKLTESAGLSGGGQTFNFTNDTTVKLTFGDNKDRGNAFDNFGNGGQTEYRRIDGGVQANAGYQLRSGIFFRGMYQLGLANLVPGQSSDHTLKNSVITISVGYTLGSAPAGKKKS